MTELQQGSYHAARVQWGRLPGGGCGLPDERVMRSAGNSRLLRVLLAGAMLLLAPLAAFSDSTTAPSKLVGVYQSRTAKAAPLMSVSLGADGTATITEDPGQGTITLFGHWVDSSAQIKVTFDAVERQPAEPPMIFELSHDGLQAVTWDHAAWGKMTPPPMKKGTRVKEMYWFDTVR